MKAVIQHRYGSPDELSIEQLPQPIPSDDQILIKIVAVSINGSDREGLVGRPLYARTSGIFNPGRRILGSDIAGRVEVAGRNITEFKPGDEVFGELPGYQGGFAEYVCTSGRTLIRKPPGLTFEQAAAIPQGGAIALRAIRSVGKAQGGQRVLINGAGGSAGSFAVQIARLDGADVTAVDSGDKLEFVRSLGADHLIDYRAEDFTRSGNRYDLILDLIAHRSVFASRRALAPGGRYYLVGGSVSVMLQVLLFGGWIGRSVDQALKVLFVPQNRKDLTSITELCVSGEVTPVIDRVYSLDETPQAMRRVAEGRAKGKVVISLEQPSGRRR